MLNSFLQRPSHQRLILRDWYSLTFLQNKHELLFACFPSSQNFFLLFYSRRFGYPSLSLFKNPKMIIIQNLCKIIILFKRKAFPKALLYIFTLSTPIPCFHYSIRTLLTPKDFLVKMLFLLILSPDF